MLPGSALRRGGAADLAARSSRKRQEFRAKGLLVRISWDCSRQRIPGLVVNLMRGLCKGCGWVLSGVHVAWSTPVMRY